MSELILKASALTVRTADRVLLYDASFRAESGRVFGIIGPSGGGKSTLLRCINRLNDLVPGLRVSGDIRLRGECIRTNDVNALRARIGMLFQQPVIFPTSIGENVLFGAKRLRSLTRSEASAVTESALREAALWDEIKDRLRQPATVLSVGQQQRLCLARALAVQPEVLLMDEPTSALDPRSTAAIEELILRLKTSHTILIVTHNIAQARRITDTLACVSIRDGVGQIVEQGEREQLLTSPQTPELCEYLHASDIHTGFTDE